MLTYLGPCRRSSTQPDEETCSRTQKYALSPCPGTCPRSSTKSDEETNSWAHPYWQKLDPHGKQTQQHVMFPHLAAAIPQTSQRPHLGASEESSRSGAGRDERPWWRTPAPGGGVPARSSHAAQTRRGQGGGRRGPGHRGALRKENYAPRPAKAPQSIGGQQRAPPPLPLAEPGQQGVRRGRRRPGNDDTSTTRGAKLRLDTHGTAPRTRWRP